MKKFYFLFLLLTTKVFALEAVVTVLESPLLKSPSYDAQVVQYLRKGDVIKIHPSIANDRKFNQYRPKDKKFSESKETYYLEDEFIPTLDRQGNTVYVLSEHLYVYFGDSREFDQTVARKDPTDYRLEEPLTKNYPLSSPSGYRGQVILGITQPYYESYPYFDNFKTKGYTTPIDLNLTLLRQAPGDYQDRLFIGGTLNLRLFENSYTFQDRRYSKEEAFRLGLGPTISYDAFKGEKNRINLSATVIVNLIDRMQITQALDSAQETRLYTGLSLIPRLALQYHRKSITEEVDFVLGTAMEVGTPTSYRAQNGAGQASWWQHLGNDKFTTRTTYSIGGYIGVQSAY